MQELLHERQAHILRQALAHGGELVRGRGRVRVRGRGRGRVRVRGRGR